MGPEMGRAAFRMGMIITLPAVWLLFVTSPGTPARAITLLTLCVGLFFLGIVTVIIQFFSR